MGGVGIDRYITFMYRKEFVMIHTFKVVNYFLFSLCDGHFSLENRGY